MNVVLQMINEWTVNTDNDKYDLVFKRFIPSIDCPWFGYSFWPAKKLSLS